MNEASDADARSQRSAVGLRLIAAFVVGFVGLTLEIAYTRVISFKIFYYYTYFVIGVALLGLGAASATLALSQRLRRIDSLAMIRVVAPLAGAVGFVAYVVVARLAIDTTSIWTGSAGDAIEQVARLLVISIALTSVFFGLGLVLAKLVVVEAADVNRLYFWDLTGAALGCLCAVPLQQTIGPPAMILTSSVLLVALGWLVSMRDGVARSWLTGAAAAGVVLAVLVGSVDVRTDATKSLRDDAEVAGGDWGAVFRVDAQEVDDLHLLHHDGLFGSAIWRYDGTPETTARFDTDSRQLPFAALGEPPERILIIGAAGGNEIQAALTYGVGHVDAVELNPVTADLLRGPFREYSGDLVGRDNVDYIQGDGRTFLARTDNEYDIVWFVAPDSYAASNAATSGAFVLSESYLYTEEMIEEAYSHLSPTGVVVAQFGDFDFDTRPTRTARYLVTAREALADEQTGSFADHTALLVSGNDELFERFSTILLFKDSQGGASSDRLAAAAEIVPNTSPLHLPGVELPDAGLTTEVIRADDASLGGIVDGYAYDISSIDDDRPFFWHFTPFGDVVSDFSRSFEDSEIAIGERLLIVLILVAIVIAGLFLGLPFLLTRRRSDAPQGTERRPSVFDPKLFVYFGAIGLGFMFIEISMIQRFSLLLGYPTLSITVSLCSLLLAAALGARFSGLVLVDRVRRLWTVIAVLIVVVAVYLFTSESVTEAALAWSEWMRMVLVFSMLFPVGVLLGVFLPVGIDAARRVPVGADEDTDRLVAWCWAVNGFFSVIGSTATTVVSMTVGFDRTLLVGIVMYLVAGSTLWLAGRSERADDVVVPDLVPA